MDITRRISDESINLPQQQPSELQVVSHAITCNATNIGSNNSSNNNHQITQSKNNSNNFRTISTTINPPCMDIMHLEQTASRNISNQVVDRMQDLPTTTQDTIPFTTLAEIIELNMFIDAFHYLFDASDEYKRYTTSINSSDTNYHNIHLYEFDADVPDFDVYSVAIARQPCDPISFEMEEEYEYSLDKINKILLNNMQKINKLDFNGIDIYKPTLYTEYQMHKFISNQNYRDKIKLKLEVNDKSTYTLTSTLCTIEIHPNQLQNTKIEHILVDLERQYSRSTTEYPETANLPSNLINENNNVSNQNYEQKGVYINDPISSLYPNATNKHDPGPKISYKPIRGFKNNVKAQPPTPPYLFFEAEIAVEPGSDDNYNGYENNYYTNATINTSDWSVNYNYKEDDDDEDYLPESDYGQESNDDYPFTVDNLNRVNNPGKCFDSKLAESLDDPTDDESEDSDINLGDRLLTNQSRLARIQNTTPSPAAAEVNEKTTVEDEPKLVTTNASTTSKLSPSIIRSNKYENNNNANINYIFTREECDELIERHRDVFYDIKNMTNDEYSQLRNKRLSTYSQSIQITPPTITDEDYANMFDSLPNSDIIGDDMSINSTINFDEPEEVEISNYFDSSDDSSDESTPSVLGLSEELGLRIQAEQDADNYGYDSDRTHSSMPSLTRSSTPASRSTTPSATPPNWNIWVENSPDEAIFDQDEDILFDTRFLSFTTSSHIDTTLLFDKLEIGKGKEFVSGASGYPPTRQLNCFGACRAGYTGTNIVEVNPSIGTYNWDDYNLFQNEMRQLCTIQAPHQITTLSQSEQNELDNIRYAKYADHSKAYENFNQQKIQSIQPQQRRWWIQVPIILANGNVIKVYMMADTGANHPCVNTRWALKYFKDYIENISKHDKLVLNTASTQVQPRHALYLLFPTPSGILLKAKFYLLDNLPVNIIADINMLIKFGYKFKHEQPKVFTHNEQEDQNLHIKYFEDSHKIHTTLLETMENIQETPICKKSNKNELLVATNSKYKSTAFTLEQEQSENQNNSKNTNKPINILCTTLQDYEKQKLNMDLFTKEYQVNYINDDLSIAQDIWAPKGETDDLLYIYGISKDTSDTEKIEYIHHKLGDYIEFHPTPSNIYDKPTKVWSSIAPVNQSYNEQFDENRNKHHIIDIITNNNINEAIEELNRLNALQQDSDDSDSESDSVDIKMGNADVCQLNSNDHNYDQMYNAVINQSEYNSNTTSNINLVSSNSIKTSSGSSSTTSNNTLFNRFINCVKQNQNKSTFNQLQTFMYSINFIMMKESFKATEAEMKAADKLDSNKKLKRNDFDYIKEVEKLIPRLQGLHAGTIKLVDEYEDVFAKFTYDRRTMKVEDARLGIKDEFRHITCFRAQYPLSVQKRLWMIEYTRKNDDNGYWEEVPQTLHCIPYLMIPKRNKEGKVIRYRPAFDARVVNQYLDLYPIHLPTMHDFDEIYSIKGLFTLMDMKNMFDCIPLHKDDRPWSTVMTPLGLRRMTHLAYGFKNCPYFAQNIVNKMAMSIGLTLVYIDDIVMKHHWHWDAKQHLEHLRKALQYCRDKNMLLNPSKFFPFVTKCTSFGFERTLHGSSISESYKQKIITAKEPTTVKEMKSFLGLIGYIARYLYNGALIQYWLNQLTIGMQEQSRGNIKWTDQAKIAFKQIKFLAKNAPVLRNPTLNGEFMIKTDACITGIGAVLYQKQKISDESDEKQQVSEESDEITQENDENEDESGYHWVIVDMYSKQMPQDYRKSHSSVHEALAVVCAFQHWQHYLIKRKFTIYTDNRPVSLVFTEDYEQLNPITQSQLIRLRIALTPFTFEIKHVKGIENTLADALSRETLKIIKELKLTKNTQDDITRLNRLISTDQNWISFGKVIHSPDTPYKPQTQEQKEEINRLARKYGKNKDNIVEIIQDQRKHINSQVTITNQQFQNNDYTQFNELLLNLESNNKLKNESFKKHIPNINKFINEQVDMCFVNQVNHWQQHQPFPMKQHFQSQLRTPPYGILVNDELDPPSRINNKIQDELHNCCNIANEISLPALSDFAQKQEDMYDQLNHQAMQVLFSKSKGEKLGCNHQKKKRTISYMARKFKQESMKQKQNKHDNYSKRVAEKLRMQNMEYSKNIAQQYKEQIQEKQKQTRRKKITMNKVTHAIKRLENKLDENLPTEIKPNPIRSSAHYIEEFNNATKRTLKTNKHLINKQIRMVTTIDDDEREYYSDGSEEYFPSTATKTKKKRKKKSKKNNIKIKLRSDSRKQYDAKAKRTDYLGEDFDELCDKRAVRQEFTHNLFGYRDTTIFDTKLFIQRQKSDTLLNLVRCIISLCNNKDCPITRDNLELYDYITVDEDTKLTPQQEETNAIIEDYEYVQSQNADLAIGIIDGTLYLNPKTDILTKKLAINKQIKYARVVPGILKHKILDFAHHNHHSHHTNWKQSLANIEGDYWWTTMSRDMRRFVLRCLLCQFANGSLRNRAPLQVRQPVLPRESVFGDFIELVLANQRFYILVLVDYCTGWTMLIPTKTNDAYTVVDALLSKWIPLFGMFKYFDSDQGSGFISRVLKLLLIGINADLQLAEPGYHRGIGKVERTIKIIQDNFQRINMQWDEVITDSDSPNKVFTILRTISPHIQAAINQRRPRISTYSPNMLMFGTQLKDISNIDIVINRMRSVFCEPNNRSNMESQNQPNVRNKKKKSQNKKPGKKNNSNKNEINVTTTKVQTNQNGINPRHQLRNWFKNDKKSQTKLKESKITTKAPIEYKFEDFEYLEKLLNRFRVIYDAYKTDWQKYTYQTRASYEKRYNINENTINRNNKSFVVGTKVLYFVGDKQIANRKWLRRFTGPWTIVVKLNDGTVIIGDETTKIQKRVSINRLKIFKKREMKLYHQEFDDKEYEQYNKELQDILFRTDEKDTRQYAKTRGIELDFQKSRQNNSTVTPKPAHIDPKNISQNEENE